jgi:hypothetical protein
MCGNKTKAYYSSLQKWFTRHTKNKKFKVSLKEYTRKEKLSSSREKLLIGDARLYPTIVDTACEVAQKLLDGSNIGIIGLVQSGKTPAQVVGEMIACCAIHLRTGKWVQPVFFTPNGDSYVGQFRSKYEMIVKCFEEAVVEDKATGKKVSIREYFDDLAAWRIKSVMDALYENKASMSKKLYEETKMHATNELHANHFVLPMSMKFSQLFRVMIRAFNANNGAVILNRDESHFAICENSTNDKMFSDQDIYSMLNDPNIPHQTVMCSATNWCSIHLDPVFIPVDKGYCGIDFAFTDDNDVYYRVGDISNVEIRLPKIESFSGFGRTIGCSTFRHIRSSWYRTMDAFDKAKDRLEDELPFEDWHEYREAVEDSIVQSIDYLFASEKGHCGALMRFANSNAATRDLLSRIKDRLDDVVLIEAFDTKFSTITELLSENRIKKGQKYAIFVTARGRMSDSFPVECGYGIDFTHDSKYLATIIQGVLGRLCGYDKDPYIVMSDSNYKHVVTNYIENGFEPGRGCTPLNSVSVSTQPASFRWSVKDHGHDAVVKKISGKLQKYIDGCADLGMIGWRQPRDESKPAYQCLSIGEKGMRRMGINVWQNIIAPNIEHLNENLKLHHKRCTEQCSLLIPQEADDQNNSYKMVDDEDVFITVRAEGQGRHAHYGGKRMRALVVRCRIVRDRPILTGFDLSNHLLSEKHYNLESDKNVPVQVRGKK